MLVKDSYIRYLNQKGFNPIAVPRESIRPLSVLLNVEHDQVRKVGTLADYLDGAFEPPEMDATDEYVSWASGKGTDRLQASVGIPFISQFLDRISGGGSSISTSLDRSSGVEITFGAVLRDGVGINSLRLILERSRPTRSPTLNRDIDAPGSAYIVTDILKSKEFVVKAYHSSEAGVTARVPQAVEASVGSKHDEVEEHAVHRERPLPFAFRAVGFFASGGQFAVDLANRDLELMGPDSYDVGNYAVFSPDALLEFP
jgi:hypothetical protein